VAECVVFGISPYSAESHVFKLTSIRVAKVWFSPVLQGMNQN
jgi:hypothetical protein